ncbi:hypothetical protein D915_001490 [Fasciola hepatica]|uniref:Uncharacterized protein n=1 Tax=Fasciola hepatica TaxID=6192 RepID=A0A4E0RW97_FASHE|nr:hypothetical protein D915_001490 [Fasciola hepatica]
MSMRIAHRIHGKRLLKQINVTFRLKEIEIKLKKSKEVEQAGAKVLDANIIGKLTSILESMTERNVWRTKVYPQLKEVEKIVQEFSRHNPCTKLQLENIHKQVTLLACTCLKLPKPIFHEDVRNLRKESHGKRARTSSRKGPGSHPIKTEKILERLQNKLKETEILYQIQKEKFEQVQKVLSVQIEENIKEQWIHHSTPREISQKIDLSRLLSSCCSLEEEICEIQMDNNKNYGPKTDVLRLQRIVQTGNTELEKLITENQETEYEIEKLRSELDILFNGENLSTEVLEMLWKRIDTGILTGIEEENKKRWDWYIS